MPGNSFCIDETAKLACGKSFRIHNSYAGCRKVSTARLTAHTNSFGRSPVRCELIGTPHAKYEGEVICNRPANLSLRYKSIGHPVASDRLALGIGAQDDHILQGGLVLSDLVELVSQCLLSSHRQSIAAHRSQVPEHVHCLLDDLHERV